MGVIGTLVVFAVVQRFDNTEWGTLVRNEDLSNLLPSLQSYL